jgi:hypothetical protein
VSSDVQATCDLPALELWDAFSRGVHLAARRFKGAALVIDHVGWLRIRLSTAPMQLPHAPAVCEADYGLEEGAIAWSHYHRRLDWWVCESVAAHALRHVEQSRGTVVTITDSGIEETLRPEFDLRYPRFRDWEDAGLLATRTAGGLPGFLARGGLAMVRSLPRDPLDGMRSIVDADPEEASDLSGPRM